MAEVVVNGILLVAYHFPPVAVSSGLQRTLKFAQYLPEHGWMPAVLTAHPRAYERTDSGQLRDIPASLPVARAFALDTARHLRVLGGYPELLALPDRWVSWLVGAIPTGLAMIRRHRLKVILSTYPIATAHLIGLTLSRLTGLPLVADFRDSMTEPGYPREPARFRAYRRIESHVVRRAARSLFTTPGALAMYVERYPDVPAARFQVIENAFDDENFAAAEARAGGRRQEAGGPLRILHSGLLYPGERDPTALFTALARLQARSELGPADVRIVLRASGHEELFRRAIDAHGVAELVELAPPLPYLDALAEMLEADALLLMQAASCNHQIPAKLYEYVRSARPVLALTDPAGDTAAALRASGLGGIVALDDADAIEALLPRFVAEVRAGTERGAPPEAAARNTRRARTAQLAAVLDGLVGDA